jgi:DNA-binding XRE family transcriptional regulator
MSTPTTLYRAFDADGALLYVGITALWQHRMRAHRLTSPWMDDVATLAFTKFATREEAIAAETHAIWVERPAFNIAGTCTPPKPPRTRERALPIVHSFDHQMVEELRVIAGLTRASLAARAGITPQAVRDIEAGRSRPRESTAKRIADVLCIDVRSLWTREDVAA